MTGSWEVGTELAMLNSRINLDFTYYRSLSDNQIINAPLPTSTGYWGKLQNAGKIRNVGYELQMSGSPIQSKTGFNWDVTLTWSKNKSMVIELYQGVNKIILDTQWHGNIEARPGEEFGGIYTIDYKRDNFGRKLIDESGFAQAGEYKKMGSINPDWMAGLNNKFSYRNFSLNFLVDFHIGGDVYSQGKAYKALFGTSVETLEGREEWLSTHDPATSYQNELPGVKPGGFIEEGIKEKNGQVNDIPIQPFFRWYNLYSKQIGTEWIQDATNIRLRELVLGYNLPRKWLSKVMVKDINLSMVGRNLFFFYRAMDHVDPESGYSSGNTGGGFEHSALPSLRSIGFNLRVNF